MRGVVEASVHEHGNRPPLVRMSSVMKAKMNTQKYSSWFWAWRDFLLLIVLPLALLPLCLLFEGDLQVGSSFIPLPSCRWFFTKFLEPDALCLCFDFDGYFLDL